MRRWLAVLAIAAFAITASHGLVDAQVQNPFLVATATPAPTATPLPAETPLSNLTYVGGFFGEYNGTGPSPNPSSEAANIDAFETNFPATGAMAFNLIYTFPGYWKNHSSTTYCNTTCPTSQDPRVVDDIAHGRFPIFSLGTTFPGMNATETLLSMLSRTDLNNLGIVSNYPAEQWDYILDDIAADLKAFPGHPRIRFGHEFNQSFTLEYLAANSNNPSNGDSKWSFPAIDPTTSGCPAWPVTTGCAATSTAREGLFWQEINEYVDNRIVNVDGCTNCEFLWNPGYGGGSNPFTLAQLDEFLPVPQATGSPCPITEGCITPIGSPGVYANAIGDDAYSYGGGTTWSGTIAAFYNHYASDGPPIGIIETQATNNGVQSLSVCSTYSPGSTTQSSYYASVISQISTYNVEYLSLFDSWSAYASCPRDYLLDSAGTNEVLTLLGNSRFSAMDASMASPRPTWTPFP